MNSVMGKIVDGHVLTPDEIRELVLEIRNLTRPDLVSIIRMVQENAIEGKASGETAEEKKLEEIRQATLKLANQTPCERDGHKFMPTDNYRFVYCGKCGETRILDWRGKGEGIPPQKEGTAI
jgi:hypothetical protein